MKLCKKQKFLASRLQRPVEARNDVIAKKLLADWVKTSADGPKTGLLAARAISAQRFLVSSRSTGLSLIVDVG